MYDKEHLTRCVPKTLCKDDEEREVDMERFRRMCILSGCDYLPKGLPGVGLVKAVKFFSVTSHNDLEHVRADFKSA